jgi:hypothetical protein
MDHSDPALRELVDTIVAGDGDGVSRMLSASPELAAASFGAGATRREENSFFLESIKRWIYAGDTALHMAAAAYRKEIAHMLIGAGARVRARNRRGQEALHYAADGIPGSTTWNPGEQAATIVCLIEAGADSNAIDMDGVSPLQRAVRTRCAEAVRALIAHGADPALKNKSGSTPQQLAILNTGRGGTGSAAAKEQQAEIVRLLEQAGRPHSR